MSTRNDSPLVQEQRGKYQPKIVTLYARLFALGDESSDEEEDGEESGEHHLREGFWREFFLLKCQRASLSAILAQFSSDDLILKQHHTQQLFSRCIRTLKSSQTLEVDNASATLLVFLNDILAKRYTNFSSDVITILTGLERVDAELTRTVRALELQITCKELNERLLAIDVCSAFVYGAFHSSLISYFMVRDIFSCLTTFVADGSTLQHCGKAITLLGVLATYDKFESRNPYTGRMSDYVDEVFMDSMLKTCRQSWDGVTEDYGAIIDDSREGGLSGILSYVGLGVLGGRNSPAKTRQPSSLEQLPSETLSLTITVYEFAHANRMFSQRLVTQKSSSYFSAMLSATSYLVNNQRFSPRCALYARLNLLILRMLVEDQTVCKSLSSCKAHVRLCRQTAPYLPIVHRDRELFAIIFDVLIIGLSHNLRKKLDIDFYTLLIRILHRCFTFLVSLKIRLTYHWAELWRTLLSLLKFLTTHSAAMKSRTHIYDLVFDLSDLLAFTVVQGDAFLPSGKVFDDFFYKLVEAGNNLQAYKIAFERKRNMSVDILISVSEHYTSLLNEASVKSRNMSPEEVQNIIKKGYETLSIDPGKGFESWIPYRETEERTYFKILVRQIVEDASRASDNTTT